MFDGVFDVYPQKTCACSREFKTIYCRFASLVALKARSTSSYQLVIESYFTLVGRINARNHHSTMHLQRFGPHTCRHVRREATSVAQRTWASFYRISPSVMVSAIHGTLMLCKYLGCMICVFFCNHWAIHIDDISFHMRYTLDVPIYLQ